MVSIFLTILWVGHADWGFLVLWVPDPKIQETYDGEEVPDKTVYTLEHFVPEEWGLPPYES